MLSHLDRARALMQSDRYEMAEGELRQAISQAPDSPQPHALLAVALINQESGEKKRAALYEAQIAVHRAPEWAWAHYILAFVYRDLGKLREAEASARESLRMDASDADAWGLLATLHFAQNRWRDALECAERGLTLSSDHIGCANLRAMALTKLRQPDAAQAALVSALAKDPENPLTHATRGWGLLEAGRHKEAMGHFQQALRLDPEMEWAKRGIVEALQARNVVYRLMLRYFFWMARLSSRAQWGVIIGLFVGSKIVGEVQQNYPALTPFLWPLTLAYGLFVYFTYTARPLFNLLLRLHPLGRLALSREQIAGANVIGACLGVAVVSTLLAFTVGPVALLLLGICAALLALPVSGIWTAKQGMPRVLLISLCVTLGLLGIGAFFEVAFPQRGRDISSGGPLFDLFLLLIFGYTWTASLFQRK